MKPLGAIRLPADGRCGCSVCRADEQRDHQRRDAALAEIVYELGAEQLRVAALERVPAFYQAFEVSA